jgi:hypothetical protein
VKISDGDLIKRLLLITVVCAAYLTARTIAGTPRVVEGNVWQIKEAKRILSNPIPKSGLK